MDEMELARSAAGGDDAAWREFLKRYFSYISSIISRFTKDTELIADLTTSLVEKLKSGKLSQFSGKSSVKTWLFVVTVNHCRDFFRSKKGIKHIKSLVSSFSRVERRFFELYYIEGLPMNNVYESMKLEMGETLSYLDLLDMDENIRARADRKGMKRIIEALLRQRRISLETDATSQYDERRGFGFAIPSPPQELLLEKEELMEALKQLEAAISKLPHRDQIILKLRFEHKVSARKICEILDLSNEKQVYRCVEKLIARIKSTMLESGMSEESYAEIASNIDDLISYSSDWRRLFG